MTIDTLRVQVTDAVRGVEAFDRPEPHMQALAIVALASALRQQGYEVSTIIAVAEAGADSEDPVTDAISAMIVDEQGLASGTN